jgi:hypothetical protein
MARGSRFAVMQFRVRNAPGWLLGRRYVQIELANAQVLVDDVDDGGLIAKAEPEYDRSQNMNENGTHEGCRALAGRRRG